MLRDRWHNTLNHLARRRWVTVLLAAAAVLVGMYLVRGVLRGDGRQSGRSAAEDDSNRLAVRLIQPKRRDIVRVVGQPSFVVSYERSSVYPKMTAYIEKWQVDIGDQVKKGSTLARLFVPELVEEFKTKQAIAKLDQERIELARKQVKVAEADVRAAEASLTEAQAILLQYQAQVERWDSQVKRLRREVERGVVDPQILLESENQFKASTAARDAAKATIMKAEAALLSKKATDAKDQTAVAVAQANLAVAESEVKRLEALVGYLTLTAPFDGVIVARNANTGDFVLPATGDPTAMRRAPDLSPSGGAAPIYVVDRIDVVRVFVDIPEKDANFVQKGSKATVLIRAFRDQPIPASVTRTSWALNVKSRTLRAEIDLPNTNAQILPGMYAYGKVIIRRPGVWALPLSALAYSGDKTFCWSYKDGVASRTEIETGVNDAEWIEVTNRQLPPLASGADPWTPFDGSEQVITADDLSILTEGQSVQLAEKSAGTGP